jgi:hypothetical protein
MAQHYIFRTENEFVFCSEDKNPKINDHGKVTLIKSKKCNKSLESCLDCMANCLNA